MAKTKKAKAEQEAKMIVRTEMKDKVGTRGRMFEGIVTKKFPKRIVM